MLRADALRLAPEIILAWLDVHAADAAARLEALRTEHRRKLPAIMGLPQACDATDLLRAAEIGLDDLLCDDDPGRLAARARLLYESRTRFAQASPLTGLPGVGALEREINRRLPQRGHMALLAFDVDHFKAYNDKYGYQRGDDLLRRLWGAIEQALGQHAEPDAFLAHLGGDDFFALVQPAEAPVVAACAIALFEAERAESYDAEDMARGEILARDRHGNLTPTPLVTLTVAGVTNESEDLRHSGQLAAVLAELKDYGKAQAGSVFVPDRRRTHDHEASWRQRPGDRQEPRPRR
jgi:diguanylate cyclase (GGDEF)-like protein